MHSLFSTAAKQLRALWLAPNSPVCADGYGGTFVTGVTATASGCVICPAGSYGSQLDHSTACKSCKSVGPQAISDHPGAPACNNCMGTTMANADATACIEGGFKDKHGR
jgi:hypothetical protein